MVSFGDSSSQVSSNIQRYLAKATLPRLRLAPCAPRMPPESRRTHRNNLAIRPEQYRRLRYIHRLKREYLDVRCLDFIRKHIPSTAVQALEIDPDEYESPSIPCAGFDVQGFQPSPVKHIEGFSVMWFEDKILRTVQAVLHMIPEYREVIKDYSFTCNDIMRDEDQQIFRYFMWERSGESTGPDSNRPERPVKFILAYQPPWILGQRDVELFADKGLKCLLAFDALDGGEQQRYNSTHKLWAKLWDICKMNECPWFILTNYSQWVFGGFSKGWENGYTLGVRDAYQTEMKSLPRKSGVNTKPTLYRTPTILELLVYWTVSSMGLPDSFYVPPVSGEIPLERAVDDSLDDTLPPHLLPNHPDFHAAVNNIGPQDIEPSESDLSSGNSTEVPSSAGVHFDAESDFDETPPPFLNENWRLPTDRAASTRNATNVHGWLKKTSPPSVASAPSIARAPSPVGSEWSDLSLATVQPRRYQGFHNIDTVIFEDVYEYDVSDRMDLT